MPRVREILEVLEYFAPKRYAFSFDKVGHQIGNLDSEVKKGVVSLDRSLGAIKFSKEVGAQLLISHHPLIWEPLKTITTNSYTGRAVLELIKSDIAFIAAHTNWDAAKGGINDTLAERLGLIEVHAFGEGAEVSRLKVVIFAPEESASKIIDAASEAGAGQIGLYSRCAFLLEGMGTFFGGDGSAPVVGKAGTVERAPEIRIEMILPVAKQGAVSKAILRTHPYEEPAFDFFVLSAQEEQPIGRIGKLETPMKADEFTKFVQEKLNTTALMWGDPSALVKKVAVCGGAADDEWMNAQRSGADVFVTGEVKQHVGLEASESGFSVMAAGHFATEHPGCVALANRLQEAIPSVDWSVFEPQPGFSGRPLS